MSNPRAVFVIVVLLVLGTIAFFTNQTRELKAVVAASKKESENLNKQVRELNKRVVEAERRSGSTEQAVEAPQVPSAPAAAPQRIEVVATPGVTTAAPQGWSKNGSKPGAYVVGVDSTQTYAGMPSAYVRSVEASIDGFGGMMQMSQAEAYAGKRVRYSGWVKTQDANDEGGHLWFRIDGRQNSVPLGFDNMANRAVKGSTDWQFHSVVLDVPAEAAALAYGFFVGGTGQMWVSGAKIEEVGADVPTTNMMANPAAALPGTPTNLDFK